MNEDVVEADLVLEYLDVNKYKDVRFYFEKKSTNTLENVTETLKNPEFKKCKSLLFIFKSHGAGRGYLTLRKFFQSADILQLTFDCQYERENKSITRNNWHSFAFARSRVYGEYLRINNRVFALGDVSGTTPMLAQVATQQGMSVAGNIIANITNKPLLPFIFNQKGLLVSLGKWYAAGEISGITMKGPIMWLIWRTIYLFNFHCWRKRIEIVVEWIINLFSPRDITEI